MTSSPLAGRLSAALLAATMALSLQPLSASADPLDVLAQQVTRFELGSAATRFGKVEFLGGLVLSSPDRLFGSLSSIRFLEDRQHFVAILDTGHWLTGRVERNAEGKLSGVADVDIVSMKDGQGRRDAQKYNMDSEGLALRGDQILVSFERKHRVDIYPADRFRDSSPVGSLPILIPREQLRGNGGLETVVIAPANSPLQGAAVIVAERSVDDNGNLYAAVLEGPRKGMFAVRLTDGYAVSDGAFLPSGDLLLLERRFNVATGVGFRIRRIAGAAIGKGAVVDGEVILQADMHDQIDNMEGIDAIPDADGSIHLVLVSDDNHSLFQRSMMLEFRLEK